MSSDNAIERTRELLDERGVKHAGNGGMVTRERVHQFSHDKIN